MMNGKEVFSAEKEGELTQDKAKGLMETMTKSLMK